AMPESRFGWLVLLFLLTGMNDSAQAWWGRRLGSRPLAPRLSPAKTWEGLWGGLVTTVLVSTLASPALTSVGRGEAAAFGLVVALAGTAGDLAASALKRRAGVKDSGAVVPGHGGVLDRFDSLAATAPVTFVVALVVGLRP
ncbi:MAG: phosphatidate cytidylyltransferase, partial [Gemmatimonadota bacterium]